MVLASGALVSFVRRSVMVFIILYDRAKPSGWPNLAGPQTYSVQTTFPTKGSKRKNLLKA